MEKSPEIRDLILRMYQAMTTGNLAFLEGCVSHQPEIISIGTDPGEWWVGYETILRANRSQWEEVGDTGGGMRMRVIGADPQAYRQGDIGWVADRATFEFPGGAAVPFRLTAVFCHEDDGWKLIQQHSSVGVRNEDLLGVRLTLD